MSTAPLTDRDWEPGRVQLSRAVGGDDDEVRVVPDDRGVGGVRDLVDRLPGEGRAVGPGLGVGLVEWAQQAHQLPGRAVGDDDSRAAPVG